MKHKKISLFLSVLPTIILTMVLQYLPEKVPLHYDNHGNIDSMGNKYNLYIETLIIFIVGLLFIYFINKTVDNDKKNVFYIINCLLIFFNQFFVIHLLTMIFENNHINVLNSSFACLGITLVLISFKIKDIEPNSAVGLRVPWTMNKFENWKKSHKIISYCFLFFGMVIFIGNIFITSKLSALFSISSLALCTIVALIISYRVCRII